MTAAKYIPSSNEQYQKVFSQQIDSVNKPITVFNGMPIQLSDSQTIDAFGRLRVSNPETIFDSKNVFDNPDLGTDVENQPLFYDNAQTAGTGTATEYRANEASTRLSVSADTIGTRVRQTKQRFNYQPGKSLLIFMSFNLHSCKDGITKRGGQYDEKNGLFVEMQDGVCSFVRRSYATGTAVDVKIAQADWNTDKLDGTGASGITLDFSKTQILAIDYEWLGVGRVRFGFVYNGLIYTAHEMYHNNFLDVVYMSTPNLPLRSEISNDGTGEADFFDQICSTIVSEGGQNPLGVIRNANTNGTHLDADTENIKYALLGIRLKSEYIGEVINILNTALQIHTASDRLLWEIFFNPTVAGTFTYVDEPNSAVQIARGATANTVTLGTRIASGFIESGGQQAGSAGSISSDVKNALNLGANIDGTRDTFVLTVMPIGGSGDVDVEGSISWRELN